MAPLSRLTVLCCSMEGPVLPKTIDIFFLSSDLITPSMTMKSTQQRKKLQDSSRLILLCPLAKVCAILGNGVLPSSYMSDQEQWQ